MKNQRKLGFTVIELIVVISVAGILLALLLPAIQKARARARRTQCLSNLRQLGIALDHYVGAHRFYPTGFYGVVVDRHGIPRRLDFYSAQAKLLPYLEEESLFNAINFSLDLPVPDARSRYDTNLAVAETTVSLFLCPSDTPGVAPGNNYRGNMGVGPWHRGFDRSPLSGTGVFFLSSQLTPGAIRDGLSRTVAFSEKIRSDGWGGFTPESEYWYTRDGTTWPDVETWTGICGSLNDPDPPHHDSVGSHWIEASTAQTLYNHGLPPNSAIPDCGAFPPTQPPFGLFAARSWHQGGVNVVMLDASGHFISQDIDRKVWWALGTRSGHEAVSDTAF